MSSSSYKRVKKWRYMQQKKKLKSSDKCNNEENNSGINRTSNVESEVRIKSGQQELNISDSLSLDSQDLETSSEINLDPLLIISDCDISSDHDDIIVPNVPIVNQPGMEEKIRDWALRNRTNITLTAVTDLLNVLRNEGYTSLPKTAETLLGTKHCRPLKKMPGMNNTVGEYTYLGIKKGLINIISPDVYTEKKISLLIHVDGMQVYHSSSKQVWPIVVKVYHPNYLAKPFVAAIYCGDSKPFSAENYFSDFVEEVNNLVENGIELYGKKYSIEIMAIVADSPARAFLKCCKAPGTFYACERCTTKGTSIGIGRSKKRVYPQTDAELRTQQSFKEKLQHEHHHEHCNSPIILMKNVDPIKQLVLEVMHLFYLNNMKWLLDKWTSRSEVTRIKLVHLKHLQIIMTQLTNDIPCEFQRKKFDMYHISRWKASQFKFMLNYCGAIVLKNILPSHYYRHFLLLMFASRILNNKKLIADSSDYANDLLRKFFDLLPSLYGIDSQVLSWHNIIHVADDAKHFKIPLNDLSGFWGESYIGLFKKFIKSTNKPLTQIVNRLDELESGERMIIRKKYLLNDWIISKNPEEIFYRNKTYITASQINIRDIILQTKHPNNTVQLRNGNIFIILKILIEVKTLKYSNNLEDVYIIGQEECDREEVFYFPDSSINSGIILVKDFSTTIRYEVATNIKYKCALLHVNGKKYAVTLLHE